MSGGREPEEGRLLVYANYDGKLYDLDIMSFVLLQTAKMMIDENDEIEDGELVHMADMDMAAVAEGAGVVALGLIDMGWFTLSEWEAAYAAAETETLMKELEQLL